MPRNSNLAMAQEAARPKTAFSGTLMAATSRVKRMAETVSGLRSDAPVRPEAGGEGLGEDIEQRQHQENDREEHRHGDQGPVSRRRA